MGSVQSISLGHKSVKFSSVTLTQLSSVSAVYVEGLIAFVDLPDQRVEHQTVRTQLSGSDAVYALVVFVALSLVLVLSIFGIRWAFELCAWKEAEGFVSCVQVL